MDNFEALQRGLKVTTHWEWRPGRGALLEMIHVEIEAPMVTTLVVIAAGPRKKHQKDKFAWVVEVVPETTKQRFNIITAGDVPDLRFSKPSAVTIANVEATKRELQDGALKMIRYMADEWQKYRGRLPDPEVGHTVLRKDGP